MLHLFNVPLMFLLLQYCAVFFNMQCCEICIVWLTLYHTKPCYDDSEEKASENTAKKGTKILEIIFYPI